MSRAPSQPFPLTCLFVPHPLPTLWDPLSYNHYAITLSSCSPLNWNFLKQSTLRASMSPAPIHFSTHSTLASAPNTALKLPSRTSPRAVQLLHQSEISASYLTWLSVVFTTTDHSSLEAWSSLRFWDLAVHWFSWTLSDFFSLLASLQPISGNTVVLQFSNLGAFHPQMSTCWWS